MYKAFLSHSWDDKDLVRQVSQELGREFCLVDEEAFETGVEFHRSIEIGLDESSLFVLFASTSSLDSVMVDFEQKEAWYRLSHGIIERGIVFIIDPTVKFSDIPEWLQRGKVVRDISASSIAREIRLQLNRQAQERSGGIFVGRSHDVDRIQETILGGITGSRNRALVVTGLDGVGRRAVIHNAIPGILNLRRMVVIAIENGDGPQDVSTKIASRIEPLKTVSSMNDLVEEISSLSDSDAIDRSLRNIEKMNKMGDYPILIDAGGLLDEDGYFSEHIEILRRSVELSFGAYCAMVSRRRPQRSTDYSGEAVSIRTLSENATRQLVMALCERMALNLTTTQISGLVEAVGGYPPAAYFAIQEVKSYGVDVVLSVGSDTRRFLIQSFTRKISQQALSSDERKVLALLSSFSPLPLSVVAITLEMTADSAVEALRNLIDCHFVVANDDGYYEVITVLKEAVIREMGEVHIETVYKLASTALEFLKRNPDEGGMFELGRITFRTAMLSSNSSVASAINHIPSDLLNIAERLYSRREYNACSTAAAAVLEVRPRNYKAYELLIKSEIQMERYGEADRYLILLESFASPRHTLFLRGFLNRKRGAFEAARAFFEEAQARGVRAVALSRELAFCHLKLGEPSTALSYIDEALKRRPEEAYLLDMGVQIATESRDLVLAEGWLEDYKRVGKQEYYFHRLSRLCLVRELYEDARVAAETAIGLVVRAPIHFLTTLFTCELRLNRLDQSKLVLDKIELNYGDTYRDLRLTCECQYRIAREDYVGAFRLSRTIEQKGEGSFRRMMFVLSRKLNGDESLSEEERAEVEKWQSGDAGSVSGLTFVEEIEAVDWR